MTWTSDYRAQRACQKGICASELKGAQTHLLFYSTFQHSITSEKSWMLISTTVRTSAVGLPYFPHTSRHIPLADHEKEDISL